MYKNYFKIAYRKLIHNKMYAGVNIIGLTVGLISCVLITLYIQHELSFDRFHEKGDRIVRIIMEYGSNNTAVKTAVTGTKVGPQMTRTFPAVEQYVRTYKSTQVISYEANMYEEDRFLMADSNFFDMFSFPLLQGNSSTVLNAPDKLVISEAAAHKYFGDEDPIGKVLSVGTERTFQVAGVAENTPGNSQIQFDFVAPFSSFIQGEEQWWSANYFTYLQLTSPTAIAPLSQQVASYMQKVSKEEIDPEGNEYLTFHLEPLQRVHLYSDQAGLEPNGSITTVYIMGVIAILILFIAAINYTNLATAQVSNRSGEIGIRKAMGAEKTQLFGQLLGEALFLTLLSLVLAIFISSQLVPYFNELSGVSMDAGLLWNPVSILVMLVLCLLISLGAGAYPAFLLSNVRLTEILKSSMRLSPSGGGLRKSLIVFQFIISICLIIATLMIDQQMSFIRHKELGYDKEHILVLPIDRAIRQRLPEIKDAIALQPNVLSVSSAYETPTFVEWGDGIEAHVDGIKKTLNLNAIPVDRDFVETMGLEIVAGSNFTQADLQKQDTSNNYENYRSTFILNETAVKALGWTPEEAIGREISKAQFGEIKAVVKDFHFASMHQPIGPLLIFLDEDLSREMLVKVSGENLPATIASLESVWKERIAHRPFEYHFLDDEYDAMYRAEQRTGHMFTIFSVIAIVLACMGLFALAAYTTSQRTKEIGIRKVLGASVTSVTTLLSMDFIKLVLFALIIAVPVAWYSLDQWLHTFAYRIPVHWWIFVLAGIVATLIALLAVSFQTIRAASVNPIKSLRNE